MSGLFVPAPGGATAPGGTPWFAMGGPSRGGASSATPADPGVDATGSFFWAGKDRRYYKGPWGDFYGEGGVRLVKRELSGHRVQVVHPTSGEVLGEWREDSFQDSFGRGLRRVAEKIKDAPGIVGFALGFALPFMAISPWTKIGISVGVGLGGYGAEPGSFLRRLSYGAGIGGLAGSGVWLYKNWPTLDQAAGYLYNSLKVIDFRPPPEFRGWGEGLRL